MKISKLQKNLESIYRIEKQPSLEPFLFPQKSDKSPQVLMKKEKEGYSLRVLIGEKTLNAIEERGLANISLQQFLNAAEEVSHFTYLYWSITNDREVSLLDIELQGEIDKFLLAQTYFSTETEIFSRLFEQSIFKSELTPAEKERYIEANRLGGKFCKALISGEQSLEDLRKFYRQSSQMRLGRTEKL